MSALTAGQASNAYNILVLYAGANPVDREQFVLSATEPHTIHEYRFQGGLGFGGKFYVERAVDGIRCRIGCYPKDMTFERAETIRFVNALLTDQ